MFLQEQKISYILFSKEKPKKKSEKSYFKYLMCNVNYISENCSN